MATVRDNAEFDVAEIWRWRNWPERERLTGLDGRDHGIDLVAAQTDGTVVAIQCKCHAEDAVIGKAQVDSFLSESARGAFGLRWSVSTCRWNAAAERAIGGREPRAGERTAGLASAPARAHESLASSAAAGQSTNALAKASSDQT